MGLFNRKSTATPTGTTSPAQASGSVATLDAPVFDAATSAVADITGEYVLDVTHTRIGFSARHAMVTTVRGQFNDFEATANIDTANPAASSAEVRIKAASIDTGNEDRDGHLRSGDFLDVDTYADLVFKTTAVSRKDADTFTVIGTPYLKLAAMFVGE